MVYPRHLTFCGDYKIRFLVDVHGGGDEVVGFYPVEVSLVGRGVLRVLGLVVCRRLAKGREEGR